MILDTGSSGSGFVLLANDKTFLITAKHVLYDDKIPRGNVITMICPTESISNDEVFIYTIDMKKCLLSTHEDVDIASIEIGHSSIHQDGDSTVFALNSGIATTSRATTSQTVGVDATTGTKLLKDVLVSNDVFLYGYPSSLGLTETPQFDYKKPLLRKGIVANIYPEQSTIIIDCPVYFGNSGGPVIEVEKDKNGDYHHMVIGVVSQYVPFVQQLKNLQTGVVNSELLNSGYSVAVSMDKVFELIGYTPD